MKTKRSSRRNKKHLKPMTERLTRIYDNGGTDNGGTFDQYTVLYLKPQMFDGKKYFYYRGMSEHPTHPQGFGQSGETNDHPADYRKVVGIGKKNFLGKRIQFKDLPADCKRLVLNDLKG